MLLRPRPRSTLFPYTTLFRSLMKGGFGFCVISEKRSLNICPNSCSTIASPKRSEEHTSELQSRPHLVCRLLLETKEELRPRSPAGRDPRLADPVAGVTVTRGV